jgi:hypothetical protein
VVFGVQIGKRPKSSYSHDEARLWYLEYQQCLDGLAIVAELNSVTALSRRALLRSAGLAELVYGSDLLAQRFFKLCVLCVVIQQLFNVWKV